MIGSSLSNGAVVQPIEESLGCCCFVQARGDDLATRPALLAGGRTDIVCCRKSDVMGHVVTWLSVPFGQDALPEQCSSWAAEENLGVVSLGALPLFSAASPVPHSLLFFFSSIQSLTSLFYGEQSEKEKSPSESSPLDVDNKDVVSTQQLRQRQSAAALGILSKTTLRCPGH